MRSGVTSEGSGGSRDRPERYEMSGGYDENGGWVELDDVHIVAYLHCRGLEFKTVTNEGGRVMFLIYGNNVDQLIREFHGGHEVNVNQYVKSMKFVKGCMYSAKYRDGER